MPIEVITGLPGNGKTLLMVDRLLTEAQKAERPLYQAGIDGLRPGLAERLENAREWNAIDPSREGECTCGKRPPHAHVIPDGALIFVDEAWKWFGHLHDARGQQTPPAVLELAEHRHRGIDFVWTTQAPNQLYPFARALIAGHSHVVRRFGTHFATIYTWSELNEDVKSKGMREASISRSWRFPKAVFDAYKSATVHTIKRKLPLRMFVIPAAVIGAGFFGWLAYNKLKPAAVASSLHASPAASGGLPTAAAASTGTDERHKPRWANADDYAKAHTPRMLGRPWSAPIYDDRAVTTDPRLLCVIKGDTSDKDSECSCYTEQATPYPGLTDQQCRLFALHGVYDPYIQHAPVTAVATSVTTPGVSAGVAGHAVVAGEFAQVPGYGHIHTEQPAPPDPYKGYADK